MISLKFLSGAAAGALAVLISTNAIADAVDGAWSPIMDWDFIPLHAVNLPDGRILTYGGTPFGGQGGHLSYTIYDPSLGFGEEAQTRLPNTTAVDTFCSAMMLMPQSGRVVTVSGDSRGPRNSLERNEDVLAYDTNVETVTRLNRPMTRQRWYGTPVMTGQGEYLMLGGTCWGASEEECTYFDGNRGRVPEIYRPGDGWSRLDNVSVADGNFAYGQSDGMFQWWYPRSFLMSNGNVFSLAGGRAMSVLDPRGEGNLTNFPLLDTQNFGATNSAVMYRPDRILVTGGGGFDSNGQEPDGRRFANIFDVSSGAPVRNAAAPMTWGRQWHNMTMLPDGRVLVTGGSTTNNVLEGVRNEAEVWDPETNTWEVWAAGPTPRLYHSAAVLMQDGRVFTGGGGAPGPLTQKNADIFSPPYLFGRGIQNRLEIQSGPETTRWGQTLDFGVSDANRVDRVTLIGYGGTTHSINFGQRFMELDFTRGANNSIRVTMPSNRNIAPPQYYMMFVLDRDGTPSVAHTFKMLDGNVVASPDLEDLAPSNLDAQPARVASLPNDSFEGNSVAPGTVGAETLDGWVGTLEIWNSLPNAPAFDGDSLIELDSAAAANSISRPYNIDDGEAATISFYASARPGVSAASNQFEVLWNGQLLDTITQNGVGLGAPDWQRFTYQVTGSSGQDRLTFRENDDNGLGALLDLVTLTPSNGGTGTQVPVPTGPNLVTNGGFEQNSIGNGGFGRQSIAGWNESLEIWRNLRGFRAAEGNSWIEIDRGGPAIDRTSTNVDVATGQRAVVSFASAPRPGVNAASNAFNVLWNGRVIDTISVNGVGKNQLDWERYSYAVTGAAGDDVLSFEETSTDGLGALLDAVAVNTAQGTGQGAPTGGINDPGNGSAETNSVPNGGAAIVQIPGWDQPVEVWRNHLGYNAANGNSWIEIDRAAARDTTSRTYDVPTGAAVTISFSSAPRPGQNAASNAFDVLWNGAVLGRIQRDGIGATALDWETTTFTATGAAGADILAFQEVSSNGSGSLLDNVVVTATGGSAQITDPGNGGVESNSVSNGGFAIARVPGWDSEVEIWRNHRGLSAFEGQSWIEVDARGGASDITRNYDVPTGQSATLSFASAPRPGVSAASNRFRVIWNGQVVGNVAVDGAGETSLNWRNYSFVVTGAAGQDTLTFRELDADSVGAMLDAVTLQ